MLTTTFTTSKLAILGGTPVCSESLQQPAWPPISEATAERLKEVYLSGQWSFNSPAEQEFAQAFAAYHDAKHGIFMANGTVTLQCALAACGVGPGDEVIVPALTWMATAMAVHYVGAKPVFVDIEPDTLCLDPTKIEAAITGKTKAIMPVHLYASMADIDAILNIAGKHGLTVIEDCAHMHGGKWNGRGVGSWGKIGSFSFQQSKTVTSGEGGICITDDDELAEKLFRMKHIGYACGMSQGQADQGPPAGLTCYNFRATAFQAVILSDQLKELKGLIERYGENASRLEARLADVPGVRIQARGRLADPQGYYCMTIIFDGEQTADVPLERIGNALEAEGLVFPKTYGPVYKHTLYNLPADSYRIDGGSCPVAETICEKHALLLMHQWLASDEKTIDAIGEIIAKVALDAEALRQA
ncbi:MAG: DegT/DnrJ/EryC1/StrS family aminotransferase [Phycisphaerae bacterium]|nr:DegT/DnrJ/EryC1/StrS family aminotransferase [Phycisphaerae bacterium]